MTDVGARCPACAPRRKLPQLELSPLFLLRGAAATAVAGALLGVAWWVLLPGGFGFFSIFIGMGLGYGVAECVSMATNRKFGPPLQMIAALGVLLAYVIRNLLTDGAVVLTGDIYGYISVIVGVIVAAGRLRF